eukprot:RCo050115
MVVGSCVVAQPQSPELAAEGVERKTLKQRLARKLFELVRSRPVPSPEVFSPPCSPRPARLALHLRDLSVVFSVAPVSKRVGPTGSLFMELGLHPRDAPESCPCPVLGIPRRSEAVRPRVLEGCGFCRWELRAPWVFTAEDSQREVLRLQLKLVNPETTLSFMSISLAQLQLDLPLGVYTQHQIDFGFGRLTATLKLCLDNASRELTTGSMDRLSLPHSPSPGTPAVSPEAPAVNPLRSRRLRTSTAIQAWG